MKDYESEHQKQLGRIHRGYQQHKTQLADFQEIVEEMRERLDEIDRRINASVATTDQAVCLIREVAKSWGWTLAEAANAPEDDDLYSQKD